MDCLIHRSAVAPGEVNDDPSIIEVGDHVTVSEPNGVFGCTIRRRGRID